MRIGYGISVAGSNQRNLVSEQAEPAPSGIPVATTSSVIVASSPDGFNGTYDKQTATQWEQPLDVDKKLLWDSVDAAIPNRWSLYNSDTNAIVTHQTWSDETQIPMSGWPNGETITAA